MHVSQESGIIEAPDIDGLRRSEAVHGSADVRHLEQVPRNMAPDSRMDTEVPPYYQVYQAARDSEMPDASPCGGAGTDPPGQCRMPDGSSAAPIISDQSGKCFPYLHHDDVDDLSY